MQPDLCGAVGSAVVAYALARHASLRSSVPIAQVAVVPAWDAGFDIDLWAIDHVPTGGRVALFLDQEGAVATAERLSPTVFGQSLPFDAAAREDLVLASLEAGLEFREIRTTTRPAPLGVFARPAFSPRLS